MTSKAHVEYDLGGVRVALLRESAVTRTVAQWPLGFQAWRTITEPAVTTQDDDWLRLDEDDARAIYEALAEYFGHAGHDIRTLRKDYEAERARVDRLITYATKDRP